MQGPSPETLVLAASLLLLLTAVLLIAADIARLVFERRRRLAADVAARWSPVFDVTVIGGPLVPPVLSRRDRRAVLLHWCHYREVVAQEGATRLRTLAGAAGLDRVARELWRSRRPADRLLAARALGLLGDGSCWDALAAAALGRGPLRLEAGRALVRIDPHRAVQLFAGAVAASEGAGLLPALAHAPAALAAPAFAEILLELDDSTAKITVLRLLTASRAPQAAHVVRTLLSSTQEDAVVVAALAAIGAVCDPTSRELVVSYTEHENGAVRAAAVAALRRINHPDDFTLLASLLTDDDATVRREAAEALAAQTKGTAERLALLLEHHPDTDVRGVLVRAVAERAASC